MRDVNLDEIRQLPIREVATRLGIKLLNGNKAMCFGGHDSRTPSLSFVPTKNIWKCFGCDRKGNNIGLVMQCLELDFKDALEWFASEFGIRMGQDLPHQKDRTRKFASKRAQLEQRISKTASNDEIEFSPDPELYAWLIERCGAVSHDLGTNYLQSHGIHSDTANRFKVRELCDPIRAIGRMVQKWGAKRVFCSGLAWGNNGNPTGLIWSSYTILFPFLINGAIGYIQGRHFKKDPKYLNLRRIPKPLFNIDRLLTLPSGSFIHICEGVPDALALETCGLAAVAVLGASSFRPEWVEHFIPYNVVLLPDGDSGGNTFRRTILEMFKARGKAVQTIRVPKGKDAADVIAELGGAV
jgi:DNA primase